VFDHRASIVRYLESQATKFEVSDQRDEATALRATASSVAALLDITAGVNGIACPVTAIIREVAAQLGGANHAEVIAPSRGSLAAIRIRFAAMWVAKKRLGWSDERLETGFRRERSTITHGIERADEIRASDEEFRVVTDALVTQEIRCEHCQMPLTA
jgi:hypothetical protein